MVGEGPVEFEVDRDRLVPGRLQGLVEDGAGDAVAAVDHDLQRAVALRDPYGQLLDVRRDDDPLVVSALAGGELPAGGDLLELDDPFRAERDGRLVAELEACPTVGVVAGGIICTRSACGAL